MSKNEAKIRYMMMTQNTKYNNTICRFSRGRLGFAREEHLRDARENGSKKSRNKRAKIWPTIQKNTRFLSDFCSIFLYFFTRFFIFFYIFL